MQSKRKDHSVGIFFPCWSRAIWLLVLGICNCSWHWNSSTFDWNWQELNPCTIGDRTLCCQFWTSRRRWLKLKPCSIFLRLVGFFDVVKLWITNWSRSNSLYGLTVSPEVNCSDLVFRLCYMEGLFLRMMRGQYKCVKHVMNWSWDGGHALWNWHQLLKLISTIAVA